MKITIELPNDISENLETLEAMHHEPWNEALSFAIVQAISRFAKPLHDNPLEHCRTVEEVEDNVAKMKIVAAWCSHHPDGGEVETPQGRLTFDVRDVRRRAQRAQDVIDCAPDQVSIISQRNKLATSILKENESLLAA